VCAARLAGCDSTRYRSGSDLTPGADAAGEREDHARRNTERDASLVRLAKLAPTARLEGIIQATDYPLAAFPGAWAEQDAAERVSEDLRRSLASRLKRAPKGPWRELADALRKVSGDRPPD